MQIEKLDIRFKLGPFDGLRLKSIKSEISCELQGQPRELKDSDVLQIFEENGAVKMRRYSHLHPATNGDVPTTNGVVCKLDLKDSDVLQLKDSDVLQLTLRGPGILYLELEANGVVHLTWP